VTTVFVADRDAGLRVGYAATDWSQPISYEDYQAALAAWEVQAIKRDGEVIGAVFTKDGELHVSIRPDWRKKWLTKGVLKMLFSQPVCTRIASGHDYMRGILSRLGFKEQPDGMFVKEQCYGH
jgi:hypothetical protein